jgi:predicted secreted hydrolase
MRLTVAAFLITALCAVRFASVGDWEAFWWFVPATLLWLVNLGAEWIAARQARERADRQRRIDAGWNDNLSWSENMVVADLRRRRRFEESCAKERAP